MNKTHIFSMDPNSHKMQSGKVVKSKLRMSERCNREVKIQSFPRYDGIEGGLTDFKNF